jgi:predicted Zn finger-like uncharacterized protein
MDGTTLCPHCNTRFRIAAAQKEAHHGMVRCGHCLQAFDARPGFIPDEPDPQLELPMLNEQAPLPEPAAAKHPDGEEPAGAAAEETAAAEAEHHEALDFTEMLAAAQGEARPDTLEISSEEARQERTLAERVAIVPDEMDEVSPAPRNRRWPWIAGSSLLAVLLLAQAAYFFRVELAARLPGLKPALIDYCRLLACDVPLPQHADLMGIESSDLEADPARENRITLNALLRNRAPYAQAFPNLELTLNDLNDKPLARRVFRPADYLHPPENEQTGLLPNHELAIKLRLDVTELRPTGYRLALLYPAAN